MANQGNREKLCEALLRLLPSYPLDQIQVKQLVGEAGINRTSFYYHFHSVADVLNAIVDELAEGIYRSVLPFPNPGEATMSDITRQSWHLHVAYMYEHRHQLSTLMRCGYQQDLTDSLLHMVESQYETMTFSYRTSDGAEKVMGSGPVHDYYVYKISSDIIATVEFLVKRSFCDPQDEIADAMYEANTLEFTSFEKTPTRQARSR